MHAFLAERMPPIDGPVAARVRRDFCAFVVKRAIKAERHRDVEANLVESSRLAIAQSLALLAKVPDTMERSFHPANPDRASEHRAPVHDEAVPWRSLMADHGGERYFFDIDDGGATRRDEIGMVLPSRDAVPHEAKTVLFDLAYAVIPGGRPRFFSARVRDRGGAVVYSGTMTMRPLPTDRS